MTETELSNNDKLSLKKDIKISIFFGLLFSIILVLIVWLIPGILFFFGNRPSQGFLTRSAFILVVLFLPFIFICMLFYLDLKVGKKLIFKTNNYEITKKKNNTFILMHDENNQRIKIDDDLISHIDISQALTIETSKLRKSLLFISHDNINLLDIIYKDDNK